jgi:YegS/Rv2252/BmrU family lipid kinase
MDDGRPVEHPTLGRMLVIVNPRAGRGSDEVLDRLVLALAERDIVPDVVATEAPGDATRVAQEAADSGRRLVVAVGGDGTVHEVVNGLVDVGTGRTRGDDPVLGVVSAGSGCDLVRTFGLDRSPEVMARHLASPDMTRIDLGRVSLTGLDGRRCTRVFHNVAEVGLGGAVATAARRLPARLGERRYRLGIVAAWGSFRRVDMTVEHDGGVHRGALCNVVIANGQFFGGGLKVAPRSLPDDGRFDVQAWGGSVTDVVRAARQLRDGSHLARHDVRAWPSATVTVSATERVAVEADGELLGTGPATFDVLPRALAFKR